MTLIRIPQRFLIDHSERDLPTPEVVRATKRHFFIRADDPAAPELCSDAEFYAGENVDLSFEQRGLIVSAQATYRALREAGVPSIAHDG